MMFGKQNKKKRHADSSTPALASEQRSPIADPATGTPLAPREQPGYYQGFSTLSQQAYWDDATRKLVLDRVENQPPLRFFSAEEARTLGAVIDRILPQEDRSESRRVPILPGIDARLHANQLDGYRYEDMPTDQQAYRTAACAFEQMAQELHQQSFHTLPTLAQETIIKSIHDGKPSAAHELWMTMNVERFWAILLSDCTGIYYAHPWAWDEIGFGGPAYPRGYMRLENGQPEPWEVPERRYAWSAPADTLSDRTEAHGTGGEHQSHPGQGGTH